MLLIFSKYSLFVNNVMPLALDIGISWFPFVLIEKDQVAHPPSLIPINIFPATPSGTITERRMSSDAAASVMDTFIDAIDQNDIHR